jgi:hypothetical protein
MKSIPADPVSILKGHFIHEDNPEMGDFELNFYHSGYEFILKPRLIEHYTLFLRYLQEKASEINESYLDDEYDILIANSLSVLPENRIGLGSYIQVINELIDDIEESTAPMETLYYHEVGLFPMIIVTTREILNHLARNHIGFC